MAPSKPAALLNPLTSHYEFLGPLGTFALTILIPVTIYALYFTCSEAAGGCPPPLSVLQNDLPKRLQSLAWWKGLWDTQATAIYFAWYAFCVVAWMFLPGDWVEGLTMRNGKKKQYKINAFPTFLLAMGLSFGYIHRYGPQSFTFFYDKWTGFVTASILMSVLQAIACHAMSFQKGKLLATGGNSGNHLYDFWMGRELNPSIGSFDIKSFNELRPGLILWVLIDISMACVQATRRGGLQNITDSMWLVLAFQTWYVADALYNEPSILSTMDITTDGFGFMLSVGDLAWVPFVYSLQARYLAFKPIQLGPVWTAIIFLLNVSGYYVFREANAEKNNFRNGQNPKNLKYMTTATGSKLLISGWWGISRHPNYLGDLMMALAWSLPTKFDTPITYFYVVYFLILLIHRERRDNENCQKKYGKDWEEYKKVVPYRIFPKIY